MSKNLHIVFWLFTFLLASCSATKNLKEGELLYKASVIHVNQGDHPIKNERRIARRLSELVRPQPNTGLSKWGVGIHNWAQKAKKEKGVRNFLNKRFGEEPALYSKESIEVNRLRMSRYLNELGYFGNSIQIDTQLQGRKLTALYQISTRGRYRIRNVHFPSDSSSLQELIDQNRERSQIRPGSSYRQNVLEAERQRWAALANDRGFVNVNEQSFYYYVDTVPGQLLADIYLQIKLPSDSQEYRVFRLDTTIIYPNFDLADTSEGQIETLELEPGFRVVRQYEFVKPKVLQRMVLQREGDIYSRRLQELTLNHLQDLGVYQFVNMRMEQNGFDSLPGLTRSLYLTPDKVKQLRGELELNNRAGSYLGSALTLGYVHRNIFKGAERFSIRFSGGLETQLGSQFGFLNSADLGLQADLVIPKFVTPVAVRSIGRFNIPFTKFSLGYNFQRRINFYSINNQNLQFGYQWRENRNVTHELYPVNLSRVELSNTTSDFDSLILNSPRLRSGFEDVFIAGLIYRYTFSNYDRSRKRKYMFLRSEIELAGNTFSLISGISGKSPGNQEFLGLPFSQYFKVTFDFRYYWPIGSGKLAARLAPGVGYAYGNSEVIPYLKQFFVGGANSIRAFRLRQLGPGATYRGPEGEDALADQFVDQTGDIKLEMSAEYRFGIFGYLKGAVFTDVGNIWLWNTNGDPNQVFHLDRFVSQWAVGTGIGLRFDIDYFVIRLDGAFAVRRPNEQGDFEWTLNQIRPGNRQWRKDNVVYSLAIGYPF
ncbi:MAG: BamA/TamA family outer membrane protein [Saprospiraceae bacterium]|nr:BamA/TamA family outer membrane protein [Saprospiraceae bacterium]